MTINKEKYKFKPYKKEFPEMFKNEERKIKKVIKNTEIEHVRSSAIPNLGGKGIIDIAIKTPKNKINLFVKMLESIGYEYDPEHLKNKDRIYLNKIIKYKEKERRMHIHLTLNKEFWNSFVLVRDYFRLNKKDCEEYAKIKKEGVKYAKGEGKKYREYKKTFLDKIQKKAFALGEALK